jgi:hypothetical protein
VRIALERRYVLRAAPADTGDCDPELSLTRGHALSLVDCAGHFNTIAPALDFVASTAIRQENSTVKAKYSAIAALALSVVAFRPASTQGEFTPLFNGRDFTGWKVPEGDNGHWRIVDGVIDYDAGSEAPGEKSLWTDREFGDFVLRVEWRLKETPYINPSVPIIRFDGTHKKGADGRELRMAVPDADSGIYLRGSSKAQVNIWNWPIGSGEVYGYRTDVAMPAAVRAGVTPKKNADHDIGEWNAFEITLRGDRLTVVLNGEEVISQAQLPGVAPRGPIALQHHGAKKGTEWSSPPSLVQFRNISIKELPPQ